MSAESENHPDKQKATDWRESFRQASPYLGLGMQFALTMGFFTFGGYLLDQQFDLLPWLTIAGALLGMTAVFIQLFRVNRSVQHAAKAARPGPEEAPAAGEKAADA